MQTISITTFTREIGKLLPRIAAGESLIITKHGRWYVRAVPAVSQEAPTASRIIGSTDLIPRCPALFAQVHAGTLPGIVITRWAQPQALILRPT